MFGGSIAWRATQKSFLFDKAVCYYGSSIPDFLDMKINNPTMIHFGKLDTGIPPEKVQKVKKYSESIKSELIIHEYDQANMVLIVKIESLLIKRRQSWH